MSCQQSYGMTGGIPGRAPVDSVLLEIRLFDSMHDFGGRRVIEVNAKSLEEYDNPRAGTG